MHKTEEKFKEYLVIVGVEMTEDGEYPIVENLVLNEKEAEETLVWADEDKTIYKPKTLVL